MGDLSNNFDRDEFECSCGCGFDTVDYELVEVLEDLREHFDAPVTVNSACRCKEHNEAVGGGAKSQHLKGRAADVNVHLVTPLCVQDYLLNKYPDKYGIGKYSSFTHVDSRGTKARWG